MKLLDTLFKIKKEQNIKSIKPLIGRKLFVDIAIDQMGHMLDVLTESDLALEQLGIERPHLRVLEYDDEVSAALDTRREAVVSTPWRFEPGTGPISTFLWDELTPHMDTILRQTWNAVLYGYSVQEILYKQREDGKIGIDRIVEKPFEWFRPKQDGTLRYFPKDGSGGSEGISIDTEFKFMLTRRLPSYKNPAGEALLSRLYPAWYLKKQGFAFWSQFLERSGMPILIGKTRGDERAVEKMAMNLFDAVQGATIAIRDTDSVDAIPPGGSGEAFSLFDRAVSKRIQKAVLGQTLTTDVEGQGSYAAAKVHSDVKADRRNADIRLTIKTVQNIVNALIRINFPASSKVPGFLMEDGTGLEAERADRDVKLKQIGVNFTPAYFLDKYDLEPEHFILSDTNEDEKKEKREHNEKKQEAEDNFSFTSKVTGREKFTPEQEQVEELIDAVMQESGSPINPDDLRKAIVTAKDPDDLIDNLAGLLENWEPGKFQELMERALFTADVLGYGQVEKGGSV